MLLKVKAISLSPCHSSLIDSSRQRPKVINTIQAAEAQILHMVAIPVIHIEAESLNNLIEPLLRRASICLSGIANIKGISGDVAGHLIASRYTEIVSYAIRAGSAVVNRATAGIGQIEVLKVSSSVVGVQHQIWILVLRFVPDDRYGIKHSALVIAISISCNIEGVMRGSRSGWGQMGEDVANIRA